jgi:hypothetical protein
MADELEAILKRKIDLVSLTGIKPKYFEEIKKELIYVLANSGIVAGEYSGFFTDDFEINIV